MNNKSCQDEVLKMIGYIKSSIYKIQDSLNNFEREAMNLQNDLNILESSILNTKDVKDNKVIKQHKQKKDEKNFKIRFSHFRNPFYFESLDPRWHTDNIKSIIETAYTQEQISDGAGSLNPDKIKAITMCEITKDGMIYRGYSFCSRKDHFEKKIGRIKANERAAKLIMASYNKGVPDVDFGT